MRLLSPKPILPFRTGAQPVQGPAILSDHLSEEQLAATQAIGGRHEAIAGGLDAAAQVVGQIQTLQDLLANLRDPLADEFQAHRAEHAELIGARAALVQARERLAELAQIEQAFNAKLFDAEAAHADALAHANSSAAAVEELTLQVSQLHEKLTSANAKIAEAGGAAALSETRIRELHEDNEALQKQAAESDERRREADAAVTLATGQAAMLEEELATTKTRLERATADAARLMRVEAELNNLLANERSRATGAELSAAEAATASGRTIQTLEEKLTAARWESDTLQGRLETTHAQMTRLNEMNADLNRRLEETNAQTRAGLRQIAELQTTVARAEDRVRAADEELSALRASSAGIDAARMTAVERAQHLAKSLQAQEIVARRAEEKNALLRLNFEKLQKAHLDAQEKHDREMAELQATVDRKHAVPPWQRARSRRPARIGRGCRWLCSLPATRAA